MCFIFVCFHRIIALDDPPCNLHHFMNGTHHEIIRFLCGNDDMIYAKLRTAVSTLLERANTNSISIEEHFLNPSPTCMKVDSHCSSFGLHVSLQVKAFGDFIDTMNKGEDEFDSKYYKVSTSLMSKVSSGDLTLQSAILTEVAEIFPSCSMVKSSHDGTIYLKVDDSHYNVVDWMFKQSCNSDPIRDIKSSFIHLQKKLKGERAPMFFVAAIGCHCLQVFGAAWNGDSVCIDPLCSPVSLIFVPRDPTMLVTKTARVLAALASGVAGLKDYYSRTEKERMACNKGPYIGDCNSSRLVFLNEMKERPWLFEARLDNREVVVKFGQYGEDVHRFLADRFLAPRLHMCQRLSGGWYAIVMDKVQGTPIHSSVEEPVMKSLEDAVRTLHENGYVHGDLHPPNILVVGKSVCILDFDLSGKEGTVRYPKSFNVTKSGRWHPDVKNGSLITKEHDLHLLKQIKANAFWR